MNIRSCRFRLVLVLVFLGLYKSDILRAGPNEVRLVNIVFDEPEGGKKEIDAGTKLSLRVKTVVSSRLKARVFSGTINSLRARANRIVGDCWIYDAVVLRLSIDRDEIAYSYIPQEWLGVEGGSLKSRSYFLVFETGDLPDGPIKLRKEDLEDYFSNEHGYQIVVRAPDSLRDPGRRQALADDIQQIARSRIEELERRAQPPIGCAYITEIDESGMTLAFQESCGNSFSPAEGVSEGTR